MTETGLPLFSVVIPTHDRPEHLPRAVASVLGQTITDLEVVVVDDAGSVPVDVPPDPRVRLVRRSVNGGPGASRNTGVDVATGRYLAFLDDDDVWVPNRLELALAGLARAPISICWTRYLDEPPAPKRRLDGDVADTILDGVTPHLDATALDRAVYVPHDERYRGSEDVEWWIRQAAVAPVATISRTGAVVRRSTAGSAPDVLAERLADARQLLAEHRAWFRAHPRAEAMRWQRLGLGALAVGDLETARSAAVRSLRIDPDVRRVVHVARAYRAGTVAARPGARRVVEPVRARRPPAEPAGPARAVAARPTADRPPTGSAAPRAVTLRILQVITDTDRRGAQVFATDLDAALAGRGHDVTTVALAPGLDPGGLDVASLGPARFAPETLRALRREAADHDVVVAHGSSTLPACAAALVAGGAPFVYRQISDSLFWAPDRQRRLRVRAFLSRAAGVVALAPGQAEVLRVHFGVDPDRTAVIPNGVPADAFPVVTAPDRAAARAALGIPTEVPVVLSISALVPEKGVDLVIDAVGRLGPSVHLLVAGEGPRRDELEASAAALGERAMFVGSLPDARTAYAAADVVVLASRGGDSMPATLVEAAFCSIPVVATPVGAITEVVVDGDTGIVVPVGDADALVAAIGQVLADPVEAHALAVRARLRSLQRFEISAVAEQWERVLVARARRRSW